MAKKVDFSKGFEFKIFQKSLKMPILTQNSQITSPPFQNILGDLGGNLGILGQYWHFRRLLKYSKFKSFRNINFFGHLFSKYIVSSAFFPTPDRQTDTQKICDGEAYSFKPIKLIGKLYFFIVSMKSSVQN